MNRINLSLKNDDSIDSLIKNNDFKKYPENLQIKLIETYVKRDERKAGLSGKILGDNESLPIYSAFWLSIFAFVYLILCGTCLKYDLELVKTIGAIITLALGYIFGNS